MRETQTMDSEANNRKHRHPSRSELQEPANQEYVGQKATSHRYSHAHIQNSRILAYLDYDVALCANIPMFREAGDL